jgi:hypothetical protein
MSAHAFAGCRFSAANRETDRLTTTVSIPGMNASASSAVAWSPVMSATGTPWCSATSAFRPASPVTIPFSFTSQIAAGLYVCESTACSWPIEPW